MPKLLLWCGVSAILVYVSRATLRSPRSHGFYRLFAWEITLSLFLVQVDEWFDQPWSPHQIAAWLLLGVSLALAVLGFVFLRRYGESDAHRDDAALMDFEKTTTLVMAGPFKHIRHPLYSSLLFLDWGMFFKHLSPLSGVLAISATIFLIIMAKTEEAENIRYFGPEYQGYMKRTKMFVPFLF